MAEHAAEKRELRRQQLEERDKMGGGAAAAAVNDDDALRWKKEDKGAILARLTVLPDENTEARTTQLEELGRLRWWQHPGIDHFTALDDNVLRRLISYGMWVASPESRSHAVGRDGTREVLGPVELSMLQGVCKKFNEMVEDLAERLVREREAARICSTERHSQCGRETPGQRVQIRGPAERWARMLYELNCYDRQPLVFSSAPMTARLSADRQQVEVRESEGVTVAAGTRCHRMHCGIHFAKVTLVEPGESAGVLRVGIVHADFDCTQGAAACDTEFGWGWESDGSVWHNNQALRPMTHGVATGLGGGIGLGDDTYGQWGAKGDELTLELDLDRGILTGFLNGRRIGIIATELHRHEFCAAGKPLPREFRFSVESGSRASKFHITQGAPLPVDITVERRELREIAFDALMAAKEESSGGDSSEDDSSEDDSSEPEQDGYDIFSDDDMFVEAAVRDGAMDC